MALQHNAYILSIDSLSIYKEIDIASAKPSADELAQIHHYGVNEIYLDTHFSVAIFIELYKEVVKEAKRDGKNLIIVGGTSFYLKSLTTGLSELPSYSQSTIDEVAKMLLDLPSAYSHLVNIASPDDYRVRDL
jgi:tRNA dimethylallyltransferase